MTSDEWLLDPHRLCQILGGCDCQSSRSRYLEEMPDELYALAARKTEPRTLAGGYDGAAERPGMTSSQQSRGEFVATSWECTTCAALVNARGRLTHSRSHWLS